LAKEWIKDCFENHSECKASLMAPIFFPTRLLDLGSLSETVLKLTRGNFDKLKSGIDLAQMPRLYQDAIAVTRKLGVRYLWIDSLCIIQDEEPSPHSDWMKEAGRMGAVYINSYCNIAASVAVDSLGTLFFERDATDIRPLEITLEWYSKGQLPFFLFEDCPKDTFRNHPLNTRGWILQEQLLAPRALVFAKDQIRWECRSKEACETSPGG
ncbi:HET-domain-containing protein, partial [Lepidopterella palustris CBS 459.81]